MNPKPNFEDKKEKLVEGSILSAVPIAEASEFFPPTPLIPAKRAGSAKIFATVFGMVLLVGGLAAGVALVLQPQLLEQKAAPIDLKLCFDPSLNIDLNTCGKIKLKHSTTCIWNTEPKVSYTIPIRYCCQKGYRVSYSNGCVL